MNSRIVIKNIMSNIFYQLTMIISGLVVPILIIKQYGSEINGLNASISQVISYLHLVEAGIGMASVHALYKPLAHKEYTQINSILSATRQLYNKAGVLFLILILVLCMIFPLLINENIDNTIIIGLILVLGFGGVIEYFLHGKYRVLLLADQKGYIIFYLQSIAVVVSTAIKIYLIYESYNIVFVQAIATLIFILRVLVLKMYIEKKYQNLNYNSIPDISKLSKKNSVFIHQIAFLVLNSTDIIIITIFLNLNLVSVYSVYNIVFAAIGGLIISLSSTSLSAAFGYLIALKDEKRLVKGYVFYEFFYFIILFGIYTIALVMMLPFIKLYTEGVTDVDYIDERLPILFVLVGILNHIRNPMVAVINAAGHFKETQNKALVEVLINLGLSISLVNIYGLYGVLIGTIVAFIYRTLDTIIHVHKNILHKSPSQTFKRLLLNAIVSLIAVYLSINLIVTEGYGWGEWVINSTLVSILTFLLLLFTNAIFEPKQVKELYLRINFKK